MKRKEESLSNLNKLEGQERLNSDTSAPLTRLRSDLTCSDGLFIKNNNKEKSYYFKTKDIENAQFESYCAAIHRFNVTEKYVPSYKAYKGGIISYKEWSAQTTSLINDASDNPIQMIIKLSKHCASLLDQPHEQKHGVASKMIDFVSNADDPLREEDLIMKCQPFFNDFIRDRIKKVLTDTIDKLEKSLNNVFVKQRVTNFFSPPNEYYQLKFCKKMLDSLDYAGTQMLQDWYDNSLCPQKLKPLLSSWIEQNLAEDILVLSIPIFEHLDAQYPTPIIEDTLKFFLNGKECSISPKLLEQYRLIKGLGRTLIMRSVFNDWDENNSNFTKRGQMIDFEYSKMNVLMSGPFWYSFQKCFNEILGDKGTIIKESEIDELLSSEIYQEAFKLLGFERLKWSPDLISHFPNIGEEGQFVHYHPTKRLYLNRVLFGLVTSLLIRCRDNSDSQIAQFIATYITKLFLILDGSQSNSNLTEQMTDFCYVGFHTLKGALSGESMNDLLKRKQHRYIFTKLNNMWNDFFYQHQKTLFEPAEIYILEKLGSTTKTFSKEDNEVYQLLSHHPVFIYHKNVSLLKYILTSREQYKSIAELHLSNVTTQSNLVDDEDQSITELKTVLMHTEQFQQFIMNHGDEAMNIILEEFFNTKEKYQNKLDDKPYYKQFVDNIDADGMKQKYWEIKENICSLVEQGSWELEFGFG